MAPKALLWSYCNKCSGITKHDCLSKKEETHDESSGSYDYSWGKTSRFIECRGCEEVTLRVDWWHSERDLSEQTNYYPPRISRKAPAWHSHLPQHWQSLLSEIYAALHADSRTLAMMGVRTIIDIYMNETVGDTGGFDQKLNELVSRGHLSKDDRGVLDSALQAGHAAAHRGHHPSAEEISHATDIVENLLQKKALQNSAAVLKKRTPTRAIVGPVTPKS